MVGPTRKASSKAALLVAALSWGADLAPANRAAGGEPVAPRRRLFQRGESPAGAAELSAAEIAQRIDHAAESIRNDGLVVLKQPDVFSQARMTKYRSEFEQVMRAQKGNFAVILAGRIARVDQASLDSQSSLGAALTPPGTSIQVTPPTVGSPPVAPALNGTFDAPRFVTPPTLGQGTLNLGLEPNQVLDEQKSYLDRLHEIRRVNLGDDIADSAGYGLYLIRMPVSITPGECTVHGHGAEATVTIKPEFPANFLPSTFRNLVINDLVDQLGPPIYEAARAKIDAENRARDLAKRAAEQRATASSLLAKVAEGVVQRGKDHSLTIRGEKLDLPPFLDATGGAGASTPATDAGARPAPFRSTPAVEIAPLAPRPGATGPEAEAGDDFADRLLDFIFRTDTTGEAPRQLPTLGRDVPESDELPTATEARRVVATRLEHLSRVAEEVLLRWLKRDDVRRDPKLGAEFRANLETARRFKREWRENQADPALAAREGVNPAGLRLEAESLLRVILQDYIYVDQTAPRTRLPGYVSQVYAGALPDDRAILDDAYAKCGIAVPTATTGQVAATNLQLLRTRTEVRDLRRRLKTARLPADRAAKRSYPIAPGELVDFFLESNLQAVVDDIERNRPTQTVRASDIRSYLRQQLSVAYDVLSRPSPKVDAPIAALDDQVLMDQILDAIHRRSFAPTADGSPPLFEINRRLVAHLPDNLDGRSLGALCWAIMVDAALLDEALREQAAATFQTSGLPCPDWASLRFYHVLPDLLAEPSRAFNDYVAARWPVITFALDPVVDQQNILDSFSLRRDLQLALAFAFSTGKISFNQLTTFRRKIQQDEETVALNKTVTSFAHGNETFGWRITPRLQTPPSQGNLATLGSTLLRGGPRPNYALQKSKIEPGQRELVAVVVMPSFLPTIRVESTGNWFRLDDPEHLEVRTKRMLEQGRQIHELRQQVVSACDAAQYRPADIRFLRTKIDQLDAMLPIQSRVVPLPFDNAAAGFDLFTEGAQALVPELNGFEGAEAVVRGEPTQLLVYGKYISIHETRVVAGGRELPTTGDDAGYEILSREVMTVRLPRDVRPSATADGQPFVEVYLATPNGISNRLMVPYRAGTVVAARPDPAKPPVDPDGTVVETYETTHKRFPPKPAKPAAAQPAAQPQAQPAAAQTSDDSADPVAGTAQPTSYDPAEAESEPPPAAARAARRDRPGAATPRRAALPAADGRSRAAEEALPSLPGLADLPPVPILADAALVRTAAGPAHPGAVVLPTPIVVMPSAPPKPGRRTILARALDRLHRDKAADPRR